MKRALIAIMLLCGIAALIWLAVFSWKNLRGTGPALKSPSQDIARLIERAQAGANATDMPLALPPNFSITIFGKGLGDRG
jgi:hypothetical protein